MKQTEKQQGLSDSRAKLKALINGDDDATLQAIADDLAAGMLLKDISTKFDLKPGTLQSLFRARADIFDDARRASGESFADRSLAELQDPSAADSTATAALARERSGYFRWRAAKAAPDVFGEKLELGGELSVSFGSLFADVLRERMDLLKAKPVQDDAPTVEAEIVEDTQD